MIVGIGGGLMLRMAELTEEQIDLLGFAGELMLRLLKMLVLPLVAGSMVAGLSHLSQSEVHMSIKLGFPMKVRTEYKVSRRWMCIWLFRGGLHVC